MTEDDFRRLALGMPGAIEGEHMRHPDFRAHGRIFATLRGDGLRGMVKLSPVDQQEYVRAHPGALEPESGAWGRQGCTRVALSAIDEDTLGAAMTLAWQYAATLAAPRAKPSRIRATARRGVKKKPRSSSRRR